uniref:Ankyrin repeat protein n=1 Tax=Pithovirus LCPAC403 TaxID=2506596 RepID=A0A481ZBP6_9VIRU|nr:MAG: ankyrin repeat protein [Pithovirus LCPAC403]
MDVIRSKLKCEDVVIYIFEFLINDKNYNPFTLKDIKLFALKNKITNWKICMGCGVLKGLEWIEYSESKILQNTRQEVYGWCLYLSAYYGNFTMLKYFEAKGVYTTCDWALTIEEASKSEETMIKRKVKKEDAFEIFKYIEPKLTSISACKSIVKNGRNDLADYMWERGFKEDFQLYMYNSIQFNQFEMLKWIEFRVPLEEIDWGICRFYCFGNADMDICKYCDMKSGYPPIQDWEVREEIKRGNFEIFEYVISRYEGKLDWEQLMIYTTQCDPDNIWYSERTKGRFDIFMYCEKMSTSPDYDMCLRNALKNGLIGIVIHCEHKLADIDWEKYMYDAVSRGHLHSILHILEETDNLDLRPYIKYAVEKPRQEKRLETVKYLESLTDEPINWNDMTPWKLFYSIDTPIAKYVNSKLL